MSVYTTVKPARLEQFLSRYSIGNLAGFSPIAAGITNTNYRLDTDQGEFVLTLYEHHSDDELEYMLNLQQHLIARSLRCAAPVKDRRGSFFSSLCQRPAAIIHRLPGQVQASPGPHHCQLIGAEMARFHSIGRDFSGRHPNPRGVDWIIAARDMLGDHLYREDLRLIGATLKASEDSWFDDLPVGAIHADLFHDNALFVDQDIAGILDFDYACRDSLVFDIAVLLNDWCIDGDRELVPELVNAVLDGYQQQRKLETSEFEALPHMLRLTALRFWLSRLHDKVFPLSGELTFSKHPDAFREMLVLRSSGADEIEALLLPHRMR
jgi:homoserine kinase type II